MPVTQMGTAREWKELGLRVCLGPCPHSLECPCSLPVGRDRTEVRRQDLQ